MCGRFAQTNSAVDFLAAELGLETSSGSREPRHNVAPTQEPVVAYWEGGKPRLDHFRWGLVPSWADDIAIGNKLINARSETAGEKPSFRSALKARRCLVPADGFYEWRKDGTRKTPMFARLKSGHPMVYAGLWESWRPKGDAQSEPLRTFTVLTTDANELLKPIHDRMPVILPNESWREWLDSSAKYDLAKLQTMMRPYPADEMEVYEVSTAVNSPKNDGPELIDRVSSGKGEKAGGKPGGKGSKSAKVEADDLFA